jgi:hypothetical protein
MGKFVMKIIGTLGLAAIGWLILAPAAIAATVYPLGMVSSSGANSTTPGDWGRGYSFSVTTADVWVTDLAWNTPSSQNFGYDIGLWDLGTQTQIASASNLAGTAGAWATTSVSPVALAFGGNYAVTLYSVDGAVFWSGASNHIPGTADISYTSAQFCRACAAGAFPDQTLAGYNYGLVDIGYQIGEPSPVPLPVGLPMLAVAMAGFAYVKRNRRPQIKANG